MKLSIVTAVLLVTATSALAQQNEADRLAPIMVQGEKTTRSLDETATSASVIDSEDLEADEASQTLDEVIGQLPNVIDTGTGNFAPAIRGSDTTGPTNGVFAFLGGTRPRVTIQKDGRPLTYNEYVFGRTGVWDLERIEVLRGPQTTLQGRNSIAGAIIVDTKDPTFDYETAGRIVVGNYDTRQLSGVISGPVLEDELAFRLSADRREHESWVELLGPAGAPDPLQETGTDIRGKLLYLPKALPDLSAKLTIEHVENRRPQSEYVSQPYDRRELDAASSATFPIFDTQSDSVIAEVAYSLSRNWELRNTSVFADVTVQRRTAPGSGNLEIKAQEYSNELIASYQPRAGRTRLVLGTYLFGSDTDETIDIGGGGQFDDETDTVAIFGEGTLTFFERLDLTLGARYEREERTRTGGAGPFLVELDETYDAFLPKFGIAYQVSDDFTYGATIQRGYNAGGGGVAFVAPFTPYSYDEEYVWNYEAFFRSDWLNQRLRINGNVFYADYEDQQRTALLDPSNISSGVVRNAEEAISYGTELTATWLATRELEIYGGLGLLETELERFDATADDVTGNEFARAPGVNLTVGARYEHAAGWSLGARGRYVDDYYSEDQNLDSDRVDSYTLVDINADYQLDSRTRVFAYLDNVFDSDSELFVTTPTARLVDPREVGVGIEYRLN